MKIELVGDFKVVIDGKQIYPVEAKADISAIKPVEMAPIKAQTPAQAVTQMIQEDIAQKYPTPVDSEVVAKIVALEKTYPKKEIMNGLNKKYGHDQSIRLWELAHTKPKTIAVAKLF